MPDDVGLGLIVLYKLIKAVVQLLAAIVVTTLIATGTVAKLRDALLAYREHAAEGWLLALTRFLANATSARHVEVFAVVLLFDSILSAVEGWGLHKRHAWAGWLVVGATASLLPLEIIEMIRHLKLGRCLLFALNLLIVLYLLRRHRLVHRRPTYSVATLEGGAEPGIAHPPIDSVSRSASAGPHVPGS